MTDRNDEAAQAAADADAAAASAAAAETEPAPQSTDANGTSHKIGDKVISDKGKAMEIVRIEAGMLLCNQGRGWHDVLDAVTLETIENNIKGTEGSHAKFDEMVAARSSTAGPAPVPNPALEPNRPTTPEATSSEDLARNALHDGPPPANNGTTIEKPEGYTVFVSARKEVTSFSIMVANETIDGAWDRNREHLVFRVPNPLVTRFRTHSHVQSGRVIEAK